MKKFAFLAAAAAATIATPAMAQDADKSGVFVGVVGGYDTINLEAGGDVANDNGLTYGITAGYDVDAGPALIGIEAEITDTTISDEVGNAGLDIYAGLRLGLDLDANDVVYVKAGYSNLDIDLQDNLEGVRVGAGWEHDFGGFFGRFEYRYTNYNVSDVLQLDVNTNRHQAVVAIGTKF
jgi:outer membrane immunogenic protein